jgi:Uma2 family endonuclease
MSVSISKPPQPEIIYPDSDGEPMAENTLQFEWIVTIKEGLEYVFRDRPDVFVAGDLLWYPVEGDPKTRQAPDAMVVFGRPKGYRGSYMQWEEGGIAPQVVFEVLSPGNRYKQMINKFVFYEKHGVQEYYLYDPDTFQLDGWNRDGQRLAEILKMDGWVSPLLTVRFDTSAGELSLFGPDGRRFLTYAELAQQRDHLAQERDRLAQEREREKERADRLAAQLKAAGIDPAS